MKNRVPSLEEFRNEKELNEKSGIIDIGDIFMIDWDGKSQIKVIDINKKDVTIQRVDKKGNPIDGEENTMITTAGNLMDKIIDYGKKS